MFTSAITSDCSHTTSVRIAIRGRLVRSHDSGSRTRRQWRLPARWTGDPLRPRRDRHRLGQHHRHQAGSRTGAVAIIEEDLFGGTCLNVGCIPTKMFVYPRRPRPRRATRSRPRRRHVVRRSALAGDPGPHLRPDRPARGERRGLPPAAAEHRRLRGPLHVRRRPHPRHRDRRADHGRPDRDRRRQPGQRAGRSRPRRGGLPHQRHGDAARGAPPTDDHRRRGLRGRRVRARVLRARQRGDPGRSAARGCCAHQDEDISRQLHRARRPAVGRAAGRRLQQGRGAWRRDGARHSATGPSSRPTYS